MMMNNNGISRNQQRIRNRGIRVSSLKKRTAAITLIVAASPLVTAFSPLTLIPHASQHSICPSSATLAPFQLQRDQSYHGSFVTTFRMVMTDIESLLDDEDLLDRRTKPSRRFNGDGSVKSSDRRRKVKSKDTIISPSSQRNVLKIRPISKPRTRVHSVSANSQVVKCTADDVTQLIEDVDSFRKHKNKQSIPSPSIMEKKSSGNISKQFSSQKQDTVVSAEDTPITKAFSSAASVPTTTTKPPSVKSKPSRSSTMPGFEYKNTMRVRAYNDGIEFAEKKSGRKIRTSSSQPSEAAIRKQNSQAMYSASSSVPDSLMRFAEEIHQVSRITPAEELELGSKTQEAIRLQNLFDNLEMSLQREPTDAEYCAAAGKINMEALKHAIDDGLKAKNRLVTSNLRMVQRVVNLYLRNGLGSEYNAGDLMQDGTVALIRAAEKYEPQRGFRFSTYAMYWIRSSIKRSQIIQSRVIDVPQRLHENYKRIQKFKVDFEESYERKASLAQVAIGVKLTEVQVERCVKAMEQRIYSLDAEITNPLKDGSSSSNSRKETLYGLIENKWDETEMANLEQKFVKEDLIKSLRTHLKPHDVDLLLLRYGLIDEKTLPYGFSGPLTISEVSRLVGIKPDKVRRMINNSLKQLKHLIGHEWEEELI